MLAGTLCIGRAATQPDTYKATFVAYDATPPSAVTIQGVDGLHSFLARAVSLRDADRERAVRDVMERGLVLLTNVRAKERLIEVAA